MTNELSLMVVFLAGIGSFLSPCVLPLVPAYLSVISGLSFEELQQSESMVLAARWRLFGSAIAFIFGFSLITIGLMGGIVSMFSQLGDIWKDGLSIAFGLVAFVFALHMIGVVRFKALYVEKRFHAVSNKLGYLGAFLIGAAFAFGWTPCIGPQLGTVLGLAAGAEKTSLLISYSLGLAVPFMLAAVFVNFFLGSMRKMTRHLRTAEIVSGALLLVMGILLVTQHIGPLIALMRG